LAFPACSGSLCAHEGRGQRKRTAFTFAFIDGTLQVTHVRVLLLVDEGVRKVHEHVLDIEFHDKRRILPPPLCRLNLHFFEATICFGRTSGCDAGCVVEMLRCSGGGGGVDGCMSLPAFVRIIEA
jgi:hypothetical protein